MKNRRKKGIFFRYIAEKRKKRENNGLGSLRVMAILIKYYQIGFDTKANPKTIL